MTNQQPQTTKKKWYTTWWGILILVLAPLIGLPILLVIGVTIFAIFGAIVNYEPSNNIENSQQQPVPETGKAKYEISIAGNSFASDQSRRVTFTVTNVGDAPGTPACFVQVETPENSSAYNYGQDYIDWKTPVNPGERKYFEGLIPVSNNAAANATKVEVNCSNKTY